MTKHFQNHFHLDDIFIIAVIYYAMIKSMTHIANWVFADAYRKKLHYPGLLNGKSH